MSAVTRRFYLMVAIVASITCAIWCAIAILTVFVWHTAHHDVRMLIPALVLGGGAATFFHWYHEEQSR